MGDCIREKRRAEAAEACNEQFQIKWDILAKRQNTLQDELEAAGARCAELLAVCKELREVLRLVPKLARGPSRELWDGIMSDVLDAKRKVDEAIQRAEEKQA